MATKKQAQHDAVLLDDYRRVNAELVAAQQPLVTALHVLAERVVNLHSVSRLWPEIKAAEEALTVATGKSYVVRTWPEIADKPEAVPIEE